VRGFLVGSLALIVLEVFLSGQGPTEAGGLIGWTSTALADFLSPDHPGVPTATKASASTKAAAVTTPTIPTAPIPGGTTGVTGISA
jgi:hypothetical protein